MPITGPIKSAGPASSIEVINPPMSGLPLDSGWTNLGGGYQPGAYRRRPDGVVELTGVVHGGLVGSSHGIFVLPPSCYAGSVHLFSAATNISGVDTICHLNLQPGGYGFISASGLPFVSFDVSYTAAGNVGVFFGDSITSGSGASDGAHRWSTLLAAQLGIGEDNQGIGGTLLQNSSGASNNGYDTRYFRTVSRYPQYAFILYGINDVDNNSGFLSVGAYQSQLNTIVQDLVTFGVPRSRIVLGTLPYVDPTQQLSGSGAYASPFNAGTTSKINLYSAAVTAVAIAQGCKLAQVYNAMQSGGAGSLLSGDFIHPNNAGHAVIAAEFQRALLN